jgi:hypothetical protein
MKPAASILRSATLLLMLGFASGVEADNRRARVDTYANFLGTLASTNIVARLDIAPNDGRIVGGVYFYRHHGRDIRLILGNDGRLAECASRNGQSNDSICEKPTGYWVVSNKGNSVAGNWTSPDGKKTFPIQLTATKPGSEEFDRLRVENGKQTVIANEASNGIRWQVLKDHRSGVAMPFLVGGIPEPIMTKVNAGLTKIFKEEIGEALASEDYSANNKVLFANQHFFAVGGGTAYQGGMHDLYEYRVSVFDFTTGAPVDWSAYFRYSDAKATKIDLRRDDLVDALVLRAFANQARSDPTDDLPCRRMVVEHFDCKNSVCTQDPDFPLSEYMLIYPTSEGLSATVNVYNEMWRSCRNQGVVLGWAAVRKAQLQAVPLP